MNKSVLTIAAFVFFVAIAFTTVGGLLDYQETGTMTKQHFWNDGLFAGLLALGLLIVAYHT